VLGSGVAGGAGIGGPAPAGTRAVGVRTGGERGSLQHARRRVRACTVRLVLGRRVLAKGRAQRQVGARSLTVALRLTNRGRAKPSRIGPHHAQRLALTGLTM
jgi:hypothetical protein